MPHSGEYNIVTENRKELRIRASGSGHLRIFKYVTLGAAVIDVCRSGLQLEVDEPVQLGRKIELRLPKLMVFGRVVRCQPDGPGLYRLGIAIDHVFDSTPRPTLIKASRRKAA